jgi:hypothetical protein
MRTRGRGGSGAKHVKAKLILFVLVVGFLWLVIAKPAESADAIQTVSSSISTFVASF